MTLYHRLRKYPGRHLPRLEQAPPDAEIVYLFLKTNSNFMNTGVFPHFEDLDAQPAKEGMMKVNKVDHICIAVRNLEEARKIWEPVLGKSGPDDAYIDEPEKIKVARYWVGEVGFELMESTAPDGDVAKFIEKRGEGIMLIAFNVDNTRRAMDGLKDQGYPFIGGARPFRDCEFAFIHPKKMNGVLLELIDYKWRELEKK